MIALLKMKIILPCILTFSSAILVITGLLSIFVDFELYPNSRVFDLTLKEQKVEEFGSGYYVTDYFVFEPLPLMKCNTFNTTYGPVSSAPTRDKYQKHLDIYCNEVIINVYVAIFYVSLFIFSVSFVLCLIYSNMSYLSIFFHFISVLFLLSVFLLLSTVIGYHFESASKDYIPMECQINMTEIILTQDIKYCHSSYTFCEILQPFLSDCFDTYEEAITAPLDPTCYVNYYCDVFYYNRELYPIEIFYISLFPISVLMTILFFSLFFHKNVRKAL